MRAHAGTTARLTIVLLASIAVWWTHAATELFPDRGTTASVLDIWVPIMVVVGAGTLAPSPAAQASAPSRRAEVAGAAGAPVVLKMLDFLDARAGHRPTGLQPACNVVDGPSTCRRAASSAPPPAGNPMEEAP
jgi:hypothetical protein